MAGIAQNLTIYKVNQIINKILEKYTIHRSPTIFDIFHYIVVNKDGYYCEINSKRYFKILKDGKGHNIPVNIDRPNITEQNEYFIDKIYSIMFDISEKDIIDKLTSSINEMHIIKFRGGSSMYIHDIFDKILSK